MCIVINLLYKVNSDEVDILLPKPKPKVLSIVFVLTDVSSTKMDGSFFSVAMTTPLEAAINICNIRIH